MSSTQTWRETLLAHWQRPHPSLLCRALQPLSWLYAALAAADRASVAAGLRAHERAPRPLIVVGNLVAGGAGKTPTVIALAELLRASGHRPGVISRGYGRRSRELQILRRDSTAADAGDEPLLIHLRARVPVAVAERRIDAARALCAHDAAIDVLLADDGLQHHALARDVQVIVFDQRGAGNGLMLPAGPLREPLPARVPADSLVLYTDGAPSTPLAGFCAERALAGAVLLDGWWRGEPASLPALHALRNAPLLACAGTARPQRFFEMLRHHGLAPRPIALPDHEPFDTLPWPADAADVVVTEKDAVKLRPGRALRTRVWVAPLDLRIEPAFAPALLRLLERERTRDL
ncbi:MAG: tetraacyldisaccharide 4'-kinase [Burkholderiaceae bacterium]